LTITASLRVLQFLLKCFQCINVLLIGKIISERKLLLRAILSGGLDVLRMKAGLCTTFFLSFFLSSSKEIRFQKDLTFYIKTANKLTRLTNKNNLLFYGKTFYLLEYLLVIRKVKTVLGKSNINHTFVLKDLD